MSDNIDTHKTSLAWLDDSINNSQENLLAQQQLRLVDNNFRMLESIDACKEYVKSYPTDARITLIVNGRLGQNVVPDIHSSTQLVAIYVYCMNKEAHEKWAKDYNKVKGVFTDFSILKKQLQSNYTNPNQTSPNNTNPNQTTPNNTNPNPTNKNQSIVKAVSETDTPQIETMQIGSTLALDSVYNISDSCFDFLTRMKVAPSDKDEFISLCQEALQGNDRLLTVLQEFQKDYTADRAISWLNKDPFFHEFLGNMFKLAYIDAIYPCRVFIHDVHKQLKQHKYPQAVQVYLSELMSDEQFQKLKAFNGKIIGMKTFYLTNLVRENALSWTSDFSSYPGFKRILYTIEANPQTENIKPFAKMGSLSSMNHPDDVLFMIGSLFKIVEIQDEKDSIINIKMTLCADDDTNTLKALFDQIKHKYLDSNGETDAIGFGQFLVDIGQSIRDTNTSNMGAKIIRSCLDKLSKDDPDQHRCYDALGCIDLAKGDLDSSLNWYKKSFDIKKEKLQANDPDLAESYKNMASIYLQKKDFSQAFEHFNQLLQIWKQSYGDDCISLVFCYIHMASIYDAQEKVTDAISCYYRALALVIKFEPLNEDTAAGLYHNLGNAYTCLKHYDIALGYYKTSLAMKSKLTPVHPSLAGTYRNLGLLYGYMNNVQQSRENLEQAAKIYRELYPADDSHVKDVEGDIQNLPNTNQS